MGYLHIKNLTTAHPIFLFKECYALEKIDGTSAHITYDPSQPEGQELTFFGGCAKYEQFRALFDSEALVKHCKEHLYGKFTVYGEAYGGKIQRMSKTYGDQLRFIAFDVQVEHGDHKVWLDVARAEERTKALGLEFVHYKRIAATIEAVDAERDAPSEQSIRNGMGANNIREGVVLRPIFEFSYGHDEDSRIIVKHKRPEFRETKSVRTLQSEDKKRELATAQAIAEEWVTEQRLSHVLSKLPNFDSLSAERTKEVIVNMIEDVVRESEGEVVEDKTVFKEIGNRTAKLFKEWLFKDK